MKLVAAMLSIVACLCSTLAIADEGVRVIAQSGSWVSVAHSGTMTASPDVCLTFNESKGVAFRAERGGIEIQVSNDKWSLPTDVTGTIGVTVGKFSQQLDIDGNDSSRVGAVIGRDLLIPLFSEMDAQASMTVTVGKEKPLVVSLNGSTIATNAFRTCAGLKNPGNTGGLNPFK